MNDECSILKTLPSCRVSRHNIFYELKAPEGSGNQWTWTKDF